VTALVRVAAVAIAGVALYFAGIVNSIVIYKPSEIGSVLVVVAIATALALLFAALRGTEHDEGAELRATRTMRAAWRITWGFISVMALVSLSWIYGAPRQHSYDFTPYHNDAIALNECAARLVLAGQDPYRSLDLFDCYGRAGIGPDRTTPLRRGAFAEVPIYPTDDQLDAAWASDQRTGRNEEFVWRPSYPALSFALLVPWVRAGWDTNTLYLGCLLAAMALVLTRAARPLRPWLLTGLLGATSLAAFTVGGSSDLLYALPLTAAWLWRERRWTAVALGLACATKQLAWFFVPFYLLQVASRHGWREAARRAAVAGGVFAVTNLPFVLADPVAWAAGMATPLAEPMFPRGAGVVFLSTNGVLPLLPGAAYLALEIIAAAAALGITWRERRTSPEVGIVLAIVPLFFGYRSLFSYFFMLPLFAFAGIARLPAADLGPAAAREAGALTLLARPAEA